MNIKNCFYKVRNHLSAMQDHCAKIVIGACCEAWLNAEAFVALNWMDGKVTSLRHHVLLEHKKKDLTVKRKCGVISHIIEVKVLRGDLPPAKIKHERLLRLRSQIDAATSATSRSGLIFAIWKSNDTPNRMKFFSTMRQLVREVFPKSHYATLHDYYFEGIVRGTSVSFNGNDYEVHLRALYVTQRRHPSRSRHCGITV